MKKPAARQAITSVPGVGVQRSPVQPSSGNGQLLHTTTGLGDVVEDPEQDLLVVIAQSAEGWPDSSLKPGHAFHVCVMARRVGFAGVGVSETVTVTKSGAEVLTSNTSEIAGIE